MRTPDALFLAYLQLSIAMTPLLLLLRLVSGFGWTDKKAARDRRLLWCVVLAQLLLPWAALVPDSLTLPVLPAEIWVRDTQTAVPTVPRTPSTFLPVESTPEVPTPVYTEPAHSSLSETTPQSDRLSAPVTVPEQTISVIHPAKSFPVGSVLTLAAWVWLLVGLAKLLRQGILYRRFCRQVQKYAQPVPDELRDAYASLCADHRRPPLLRCSAAVDSPMLYGIFRPVLCMPPMSLEPAALPSVLRHELTHWRRGDLCWKWLAMAAGCVHWFHPLVHWAVRRFDTVTELACDEAVLDGLDDGDRLAYGEVILTILAGRRQKTVAVSPLATHFTPGKGRIRERMLYILQKPGRTRGRGLVAAVLVLSLTAGLVGVQSEAAALSPPRKAIPTAGMPDNDAVVSFTPVNDRTDWAISFSAGTDTLEIRHREEAALSLPNRWTTSDGRETVFYTGGSAFFTIHEEGTHAALCALRHGRIDSMHVLVVELASGQVTGHIEAPFPLADGVDAAGWFAAHGVEAERYAVYLSNAPLQAGFPQLTALLYPRFVGDTLSITGTLQSDDQRISLSGVQWFDLTSHTLTAYCPTETVIPAAETDTEAQFRAQVLYTDAWLTDVPAMPEGDDAAIGAYVLEAYRAAVEIFRLSHRLQTDVPAGFADAFPTDAHWDAYIRRILSPELADRLPALVDAMAAAADGCAPDRLVRPQGYATLLSEREAGRITFLVHWQTIDPTTGEILDVQDVPLVLSLTEEGWRWTEWPLPGT